MHDADGLLAKRAKGQAQKKEGPRKRDRSKSAFVDVCVSMSKDDYAMLRGWADDDRVPMSVLVRQMLARERRRREREEAGA